MSARQLMIPAILLAICALSHRVQGAKPTAEPPISYDCEEEGFFPHPKDCRKYFWCLDSGPANLGIVPHHFTCPSGLYFSTKTEACDYPANVPCANEKKNKTVLTRSRSRKKTSSTTEAPADAIDDEIVLTTVSPQTVTEDNTSPPDTTTASTTTSTTKAPSRLLKEAGVGSRQRRPPQAATTFATPSAQQEDNLKQLLQLVQSLGGVERIKTLVNDKDPSVNNEINPRESERVSARHHSSSAGSQRIQQTTPPSFFSPSYETPRRQEAVAVTETPNVLASNQAPSNQIRHRRPQFDHPPPSSSSSLSHSPSPVTVNPFLSYADPSRGITFDSDTVTDAPIDFRSRNNNDYLRDGGSENTRNNHANRADRVENNNANNFYSFSYHTPGSRVSVQGQAGLHPPVQSAAPVATAEQSHVTRPAALSLPLSSPFNDPFFSYNTPGRFSPQTTRAESTASFTTVTEPTTSLSEAAVVTQSAPRGSSSRESSRQRQSSRSEGGFVRVRVNPGGNLRFSEPGAHQGSSGRRATRVRIANPSQINPGNLLNQQLPPPASAPVPAPLNSRGHHSGSHFNHHQASSNQPSVHYDEDRELHHISDREYSRTEAPVEIVTTRRPARRRPPQREHLRNRQEENPVGALVNLPPPNLQLDPAQSFPHSAGHGGIGRPFPPRPQTLPPLPFTGSTRSSPRILPIAVPLVTLPPHGPDTESTQPTPANNQPSSSYSASFTHEPSDSGFRPGTVRYSNLNLPTGNPVSARPQFDDLFVTDFPFFGDNMAQTLPPSPQSRPVTTVTTTTSTTTPSPTTEYYDPPSTRRQRQRQRRPTVATPVPFNSFNTTPRPTRRREATTALPPLEDPSLQAGPPVEMESGQVKCARRGVFAHPGSCGQFVVCAPASRGSLTYRSYMHHCPAEQVFVEEVGRCRPGNKEKCEVFTRR